GRSGRGRELRRPDLRADRDHRRRGRGGGGARDRDLDVPQPRFREHRRREPAQVVNETSETLLRWIPLLPLLAAVFHGIAIGVVRRSTPRTIVIALSCGSVALSFVISCIAFIKLIDIPPDASRVLVDPLYTWFGAGIGTTRFTADLALRVDPLSAVMALVVTGVGSLIHVYSVGYMDDDHRDDRGFQRFFCYMNLFTFS